MPNLSFHGQRELSTGFQLPQTAPPGSATASAETVMPRPGFPRGIESIEIDFQELEKVLNLVKMFIKY